MLYDKIINKYNLNIHHKHIDVYIIYVLKKIPLVSATLKYNTLVDINNIDIKGISSMNNQVD